MSGPSIINAARLARRRFAFTLVEMLVVMGIIVLLLAATLPAFRGLNQSESRRGAVGNLLGVLDRARMMAITDGLATYVVFACPAASGQLNSDLRGRAYAIYEDADNVTFVPTQKTPWITAAQRDGLQGQSGPPGLQRERGERCHQRAFFGVRLRPPRTSPFRSPSTAAPSGSSGAAQRADAVLEVRQYGSS